MSFKKPTVLSNGWSHTWTPAAVLRVVGEDALTFLQGQFSQDLRMGTTPHGTKVAYGLWLTHKGRVLGDSFALVISEHEVWLVSYFTPAVDICAHLEKHIVADDVTIENQTLAWKGCAFGGQGAAAQPHHPIGADNFVRLENGDFLFRGRRGVDKSWERLTRVSETTPTSPPEFDMPAETLELWRLAAGLPVIPIDIGPTDLPHEGGLDEVAISYTKGCFIGQEVMARLKTGTIRRRLLQVESQGTSFPRGTLLFQKGKKVGELRSSATGPDGRWLGLAMITLLGFSADLGVSTEPEAEANISVATRFGPAK